MHCGPLIVLVYTSTNDSDPAGGSTPTSMPSEYRWPFISCVGSAVLTIGSAAAITTVLSNATVVKRTEPETPTRRRYPGCGSCAVKTKSRCSVVLSKTRYGGVHSSALSTPNQCGVTTSVSAAVRRPPSVTCTVNCVPSTTDDGNAHVTRSGPMICSVPVPTAVARKRGGPSTANDSAAIGDTDDGISTSGLTSGGTPPDGCHCAAIWSSDPDSPLYTARTVSVSLELRLPPSRASSGSSAPPTYML